MGLFFKKERQDTESVYQVNSPAHNTRLVVGLGNPGDKYNLTRHNIGFLCIDSLAEAENGSWSLKKAHSSYVCELNISQMRIILCKPDTFMNNSGQAVQAIQHFYKIPTSQTIVVHDELDIPFGQIRTRSNGGAAGHNGVKSIIQHSGEDFGRVRIGIANEISDKADSSSFVLQKFTKQEQEDLKPLTLEVNAILNEYIFGGALTTETRNFL